MEFRLVVTNSRLFVQSDRFIDGVCRSKSPHEHKVSRPPPFDVNRFLFSSSSYFRISIPSPHGMYGRCRKTHFIKYSMHIVGKWKMENKMKNSKLSVCKVEIGFFRFRLELHTK